MHPSARIDELKEGDGVLLAVAVLVLNASCGGESKGTAELHTLARSVTE